MILECKEFCSIRGFSFLGFLWLLMKGFRLLSLFEVQEGILNNFECAQDFWCTEENTPQECLVLLELLLGFAYL